MHTAIKWQKKKNAVISGDKTVLLACAAEKKPSIILPYTVE